jgi:hypothetical protein
MAVGGPAIILFVPGGLFGQISEAKSDETETTISVE